MDDGSDSKRREKITDDIVSLLTGSLNISPVDLKGDTNLVEELAQSLKEKFGDDIKYEVVIVNPTAGSHCGPNGIGLCFHARHR